MQARPPLSAAARGLASMMGMEKIVGRSSSSGRVLPKAGTVRIRTLSSAVPVYPDSLSDPEYTDGNNNGSGGAGGVVVGAGSVGGGGSGSGSPRIRRSRGGKGGVRRPIYVAATRQHVGKTTTSLALVSGLSKRFDRVGFIKPVGQISVPVEVPIEGYESSSARSDDEAGAVPTETIRVDKDVCLIRTHFDLTHCPYRSMSPCLIGSGYTKSYIDGDIRLDEQLKTIREGYDTIRSRSDVVLCEGTGHCAVGSVVGASNARVASLVGADMVLVANGGLGSTFDELELNRILCHHHGVNIAGVIINKVKIDKYDQTKDYMSRALMQAWGVPLLGCIPDRPYLGCPALADLERLFETTMVSGGRHRFRHYKVSDLNLVTTSLGRFLENLRAKPSRTMYVCHVTRDDIILGFLGEYARRRRHGMPFESALVISGRKDKYDVSPEIMDMLTDPNLCDVPVLIARHSTHHAMEMIHQMTPKLNIHDTGRVETAVRHYEPYIDFDLLLERTTAGGSGGRDGDVGASALAP